MCGRLNVGSDPLNQIVSDALGVSFSAIESVDLRPSQEVATLANESGKLQQVNARWGIKPSWAKKLLINAQAETVAEKPTFKHSFRSHRCVVPCDGWYEWKSRGTHKSKFEFKARDDMPVYMAGILFSNGTGEMPCELVTLTTSPSEQAREYHHRMPLLIPESDIKDWVLGSQARVLPLLQPYHIDLSIRPAA